MNDFSSRGGLDDMFDDELIEAILTEQWCEKFYVSETYKPHLLNFGGGIHGLTCRIVLDLCENSAEKLLSLLGMNKTKNNITEINEVLNLCNRAMTTSAYII